MRFLYICFFVLLTTAVSAQVQSRWVMAVSGFSNTVVVDDSTFTVDVSFQADQTGNGYLGNQVQVGYRLLTSNKQGYRVSVVNSAGFSSANLTIVELPGTNGGPTGTGITYAYDGSSALIPLVPVNNSGISAALAAVIQSHNVEVTPTAGGGGPDPAPNVSAFDVGDVLYVSSTEGDDATAVKGNPSMAYDTLATALGAAGVDELVTLLPGTYSGNFLPIRNIDSWRGSKIISENPGNLGYNPVFDVADSINRDLRVAFDHVELVGEGTRFWSSGDIQNHDIYIRKATHRDPVLSTSSYSALTSMWGGTQKVKIDFADVMVEQVSTMYGDLNNAEHYLDLGEINMQTYDSQNKSTVHWMYGWNANSTDTIYNTRVDLNLDLLTYRDSVGAAGLYTTFGNVFRMGRGSRSRFSNAALNYKIGTIRPYADTAAIASAYPVIGSDTTGYYFSGGPRTFEFDADWMINGSITATVKNYNAFNVYQVIFDSNNYDGSSVSFDFRRLRAQDIIVRATGTKINTDYRLNCGDCLTRENIPIQVAGANSEGTEFKISGNYKLLSSSPVIYIGGTWSDSSRVILENASLQNTGGEYAIYSSVPVTVVVRGTLGFNAEKLANSNVTVIYEGHDYLSPLTYIVTKATDETREDSLIAIDSTMFLTLPAGKYELVIDMQFAASTSGDFEAGLTADQTGNWREEGGTTANGWESFIQGVGADGGDPALGTTEVFAVMRGTIDLASETTIYLQWGEQDTGAVGFSRLYAGSFMKATKLE